MIDGLRLELRDVAPIVHADLDINRINIIGGKNSTGKSTVSKLLYCFLKANSSDNDILLTFTLKKELDEIYKEFNSRFFEDPSVSELNHKIRMKDSSVSEKNHIGFIDPNDYEDETFNHNGLWDPISYGYENFDDNDSLDSTDYESDMMEGYYESDEYYSDLADEYYEERVVDENDDNIENPYDSEMIHNIKRLWYMLNYHDYDDFKEVVNFFNDIEPPITDILEAEAALESKRPIRLFIPKVMHFELLLFKWNKIKRILYGYEDYSTDFFKEVMKDLISSEFNINFHEKDHVNNKWLMHSSPNYRINHAKLFDSLNSDFSFEVNLNDVGNEFKSEGEFLVNNVFYLESYTILDSYSFLTEEYLHIEELKKYLKKTETMSIQLLRRSSPYEFKGELEKNINQIIGGRIVNNGDGSLRFGSSPNYSTMKNTASGVKQIAVIQNLLHNGFLEDNSVLIIDEPEVNLHPEWQIKLAQILVLLAKEGNIIIYINSHSPMFIEAMDTFSEYYDFEDHVNYYLSEEIECDKSKVNFEKSEKNENRTIFKRIPNDELYVIYDNLGDPFDILDKVRLMKGKKGVDDDFYI